MAPVMRMKRMKKRHTLTMYQILILAAAVAAAPTPDEAPPRYGPSPKKPYNPVVYKEKDEILPPQTFEYKYGVNDDYSQTSFDKVETQDDLGRVTGSYKVNLPDGRVQIVNDDYSQTSFDKVETQ